MRDPGILPESLPDTEQEKACHQSRGSFFVSVIFSTWFLLAFIVLLCAITYGRTLGSYFIADDIGQVRYIHQIFSGRWDLFWSNFCGNYMQVPNMSVYRPMLLLTLVFDFLLWKANPVGYYLSNLVYFTGSALLLFVFIRQLCAGWGRVRASVAGLSSACMFALNPLHCESISWVVGRVDSACCVFYMASLCLFMSGKTLLNVRLKALAVLLFILAICVKEMAVGLAPVLFVLAFLFSFDPVEKQAVETTDGDKHRTLRQRLASGWRLSCPVWIATVVYFVVRYMALGTILGGYNGSVGATQTAGALAHWLDADSWRRLFLPFALDLYLPGNGQEQALAAVYCALAFLCLLRLLANSVPWRRLAFLCFWWLTLAAPIYRLFGVGLNLEGGRFCYFMSLSMASLVPVLLFAPDDKLPRALSFRLSCCGFFIIVLLVFITGRCAYVTNLLWLHAGKEVRAVRDDAVKLSKGCAAGNKIILLGVPKEHSGAHMILNGTTLQTLLSPPFTDRDCWRPFLTFEPVFFGGENKVNGARLRSLVHKSGCQGPFVWSSTGKHFVDVNLSPSSSTAAAPLNFSLAEAASGTVTPYVLGQGDYSYSQGVLSVKHPGKGDGIRFRNVGINPLEYAFLKISFRSSNNEIALPFVVRWNSSPDGKFLPELTDSNLVQEKIAADVKAGPGSTRTVYIALGSNWRWYAQTKIADFSLFLPAVEEIAITELALLPAEFVSPVISTQTAGNNGGVLSYSPGSPLNMSSQLGTQILVQLSRKDFFFDNLDFGDVQSGIASEFKLPGPKSVLSIPLSKFQQEGYYQLRARALDGSNRALGDFSDTLTLYVKPDDASEQHRR